MVFVQSIADKIAKKQAQDAAAKTPQMTAQQMIQGTPIKSWTYIGWSAPTGTIANANVGNTVGYNPNAVLVNWKPIDAWDNPIPSVASPITWSVTSALPQPTVATRSNPVVDRNPVQNSTYTPTDYSNIDTLDKNGLQDYIDQQQYKVQYQNKPLTQDEYLNLQRANRRFAELSKEQSNADPYKIAIDKAQSDYESKQIALAADNETKLSPQYAQIDDNYNRQVADANTVGKDKEEALQWGLSFSGFGRSTYAQEWIQKIKKATDDNIRTINLARDAAKQLAKLAEEGADAKILDSMQKYIDWLNTESVKHQAEMVKETNELNQKAWVAYEDRIKNILELASKNTVGVSYDKATAEQKAQIDAYATLAIDKDGKINETLLKTVPADISMAVLQRGAIIKQAIPGEAAKTVTVGSGKNSQTYQWNPETKTYDIPIGNSWSGWGSSSGWMWWAATTAANNELVTRLDRVQSAINDSKLPWSTALKLPDVAVDLDYIKNNLTLKTFGEAKKNGVTFGAASEAEWKLLQQAASSFNALASKESTNREIDRLRTTAWGAKAGPINNVQKDTFNPDRKYTPGNKFIKWGVEYIVQPDWNFYPVK